MTAETTQAPAPESPPIAVGLVLVDFPAKQVPPLKYFLLLLNRLQRTFEFSFYDPPLDHELVRIVTKYAPPTRHSRAVDRFMWRRRKGTRLAPPHDLYAQLARFATDLKDDVARSMKAFDLAGALPDHLVIVTKVTLSNYHYLLQEAHVILLALGEWDRSMAPPSAAEFLQLLVLRAAYSATEKGVWETIHMGTRSCLFDFTRNLQDTRMMILVGLGVCDDCRRALVKDGFERSPAEIKYIAEKSWLGKRSDAGTPANIMARFGFDLYLTKGFTSTLAERVRQLLEEDVAKELIRLTYLVVGTAFLIWFGLKKP